MFVCADVAQPSLFANMRRAQHQCIMKGEDGFTSKFQHVGAGIGMEPHRQTVAHLCHQAVHKSAGLWGHKGRCRGKGHMGGMGYRCSHPSAMTL